MGREKGLLYVVKHAIKVLKKSSSQISHQPDEILIKVLKKSSSEISHQPDEILKTNTRFLNYSNHSEFEGGSSIHPPPLEFEMCGNLKMTDYQIFLTILFRDKIKHQGSKLKKILFFTWIFKFIFSLNTLIYILFKYSNRIEQKIRPGQFG